MYQMLIHEQLIKPPILLDHSEYPLQFSFVADKIGNEEACSLLWFLPGFTISKIPPRPAYLLKKQYIADNYNGTNSASLSVKTQIKYSQIADIAKQSDHIDIDPNKYTQIKYVVDYCGNRVAMQLLREFPGQSIYVPKAGNLAMRKKLVLKEFNGSNHLELSVRYKIDLSNIYRILKEDADKKRSIQLRFL